MSSWPSPLDSLPVTTAPPLMDRRSAPVPKEMSPVTVPLRMSSTSAPEPRRMSPRMAGSLASGTPSLSASGSLWSGMTTPSCTRVTPVLLALTSTAMADPVWATSFSGLTTARILPVLLIEVSVPD